MGFTSSNPCIANLHGFDTWVIVSPTFTSFASLIPEIKYPTSPVLMSAFGSCSKPKVPISSAKYSFPVFRNLTRSPFLISPLYTLNMTSIPL